MSNFIFRLVFICQNRKKRYENGAYSANKYGEYSAGGCSECLTAGMVQKCGGKSASISVSFMGRIFIRSEHINSVFQSNKPRAGRRNGSAAFCCE